MANAKVLSDAEFAELDKRAQDDLWKAKTMDEAVDALWRGLWLKNRETKPPAAIHTIEEVVALLDDLEGKGWSEWGDDARRLVAFLDD